MKYTKGELEKLGFKFVDRGTLGIDIIIPAWRGQYNHTLRVYVNNLHGVDYLTIARPGLGGTFNLSYDYIAHFPIKGSGQSRIVKSMKESQTAFHTFYHESEKYADYVARAIELVKFDLVHRD